MDFVLVAFLAWTLLAMAAGGWPATLCHRSEVHNHTHYWEAPRECDDEPDPADSWKDA